MSRKFITKNRKNYRLYFYIFIFILSFVSTYKLVFNSNNKEYLLSSLISESTNESMIFLDNINEKLTNPKYIIYDGLNKIVPKNNLSVFSTIDYDNYDYSSASSDYVSDPSPSKPDNPIVYIYNTHQLEEYSSLTPYDYSVKPNVMIASYILREKLNDLGISSVVETNNVKEYLDKNNMSYNYSYHASEYFAREMEKKYPSIKYLIDIHRDSASYETTQVSINDLSYAKVLLVTGFEHTKDENNVGFANDLEDLIDEMYPGLSRGILNKTGSPVNGIYNQDLEGKSILIEVGGIENKIEEVYNTMDALSKVINRYIEENI